MTDRKPRRMTLLVAILEEWPIACVYIVALAALAACPLVTP